MYLLLLLTLFLSSCGGSAEHHRSWTVMVYMAADNDLDVAAPLDVQEMLGVGSTDNVTIVLQYDSRSTPTKRYRIDRGQLTLLSGLGEQNMASVDTLKDFVVSSMTGFPADHYALILSDHGGGWQSGVDKRVASILEDWNNAPYLKASKPLSNIEVSTALRMATEKTGKPLDILGIDACLMATIEAVYEFRNNAAIMVASQNNVQGLGWDYLDLLTRLTQSPEMSPAEFASAMVESYRQFAESAAYGYGDQTLSALSLGSGVDILAHEVDSLAQRLKAALDALETRNATTDKITAARTASQQFQPPTYVDLVDFSMQSEPETTPNRIATSLQAITIAEYHGAKLPRAHGLNIVLFDLPTAVNSSVYNFDYTNYDPATGKGSLTSFILDFTWNEMLSTYFTFQYPNLIN